MVATHCQVLHHDRTTIVAALIDRSEVQINRISTVLKLFIYFISCIF